MPSPWERGFVEIADRCFVARYREWDVSIGVVTGTAGALVVDTRASTAQGIVLRDDIARLPGRPEVRWVVNTHEHFDHVLGNAAFAGSRFRAHENAAAGMPSAVARIKELIAAGQMLDPGSPAITADVLREVSESEVVLPDKTFSSAATIDLGDRYVELIHPGRAHTDGDLVLRVPDCDVLFAGDLVEESADRDATPFFGGDCWPLEWAATLDLVIGLLGERSLVVPGHGTVVDRTFVEAQRDDIAVMTEMIRGLAAAGVPVADALHAGATGGVRGEGWPFAAHYLGEAVQRGYAQLAAPRRSLPIVSGAGTDAGE